MIIVDSYPVAVAMCVVTMICWGSWGNTQKLAGVKWKFQLFYWDYVLGILLFSLIFAFTLGSFGAGGRSFLADMSQADAKWLISAFEGGVIFNGANILLVAAIDIAGLAVAFPVGIGLALVLGVITTYAARPEGDVEMLAFGVALICVAIVLDAIAFGRTGGKASSLKGLAISAAAGVLMGFFYSFVANSMGRLDASSGVAVLEAGKLSAYSAMVLFSLGIFISNFFFNGLAMRFPPAGGGRVGMGEYFSLGTPRLHAVGILGGAIWCVGTTFSFIAAEPVGAALSYGLGQGAIMVSALWGVFVWKEFKGAPRGTGAILAAMFASFAAGLAVLVCAR